MIDSDKKQISGYLGMGVGWEGLDEEVTKRYKESFRGPGSISCLHYGSDFMGVYIYLSNYTLLNICSLLCMDYMSIKRKKKARFGAFFPSMIFT